ncbi:MAG: hypothetical protein II407_00975, partial [Prevotella sp.]|nr:hypothetical protein [Prevotella sp.]
LLALALAKLAQRLNINTVFPEFLFHIITLPYDSSHLSNHLAVRFFSTSTALMRFKYLICKSI